MDFNTRTATGPTSAEGKARSSMNSLKHGLYSKITVLGTESQEEYDELRADYHASLQPANRIERDLVDEMVNCRWRMHRIAVVESTNYNTGIRIVAKDLPSASPEAHMSITHRELDQFPERLRRLETSLSRQYQRALRDLRTLQQDRRAQQPAQHGGQQDSPSTARPATQPSSFRQDSSQPTEPRTHHAPESPTNPQIHLEKAA